MILTKEYLNETPQPCSSYNVTCKPIEFYAANSSDLNSEANKNYAYIIESTENLNETVSIFSTLKMLSVYIYIK